MQSQVSDPARDFTYYVVNRDELHAAQPRVGETIDTRIASADRPDRAGYLAANELPQAVGDALALMPARVKSTPLDTSASWDALAAGHAKRARQGFAQAISRNGAGSVDGVGYALSAGRQGDLTAASEAMICVLHNDASALDAAPLAVSHGLIVDSMLDDYMSLLDRPGRRARACLMIAALHHLNGDGRLAMLYAQRATDAGADELVVSNLETVIDAHGARVASGR